MAFYDTPFSLRVSRAKARYNFDNCNDLAFEGAPLLRERPQWRGEIRVGRFQLAEAPSVPADARMAILGSLEADPVALLMIAYGESDPVNSTAPD
jgi:hypothetical protein